MIDERFDQLTRGLVRRLPRRTGFRLIAGAGIALVPFGRRSSPGASAGQTGINRTGWGFGPGDACVSNGQCDNSFPELGLLVCDDNGEVYGAYGGLHCCRYDGGSCGGPLSTADNFCCGDLRCLGGTCGQP